MSRVRSKAVAISDLCPNPWANGDDRADAFIYGMTGKREGYSRQYLGIPVPPERSTYNYCLDAARQIDAITKNLLPEQIKVIANGNVPPGQIKILGASYGYYNPIIAKDDHPKAGEPGALTAFLNMRVPWVGVKRDYRYYLTVYEQAQQSDNVHLLSKEARGFGAEAWRFVLAHKQAKLHNAEQAKTITIVNEFYDE